MCSLVSSLPVCTHTSQAQQPDPFHDSLGLKAKNKLLSKLPAIPKKNSLTELYNEMNADTNWAL